MLLDSQTALWVLDDNPRLGPHARAAIESAPEVWVSAATVWELTIKAMLGKLTVPRQLTARLADQGLSVLDVRGEHAEALFEFPELIRHDPFDRLIVAQAGTERIPLLTADAVLLALGRDFILDSTR